MSEKSKSAQKENGENGKMNTLKDLLENGIGADLFKAERALSVYRTIGKKRNEINSFQFKQFTFSIGYYQRVCLHEFVMATARVYDKPSKRNKTRCLEELINRLNDNPETFPEIAETHQTENHLRHYKLLPDYLITILRDGDQIKFTKKLGVVLKNELLNLQEQRKIIRDWRDKNLVHNDKKNKVEDIKFEESDKLLDFGWKVSGIIGWAYLSKVYEYEGTSMLKDDARIQGVYVDRFLDKFMNQEN